MGRTLFVMVDPRLDFGSAVPSAGAPPNADTEAKGEGMNSGSTAVETDKTVVNAPPGRVLISVIVVSEAKGLGASALWTEFVLVNVVTAPSTVMYVAAGTGLALTLPTPTAGSTHEADGEGLETREMGTIFVMVSAVTV